MRKVSAMYWSGVHVIAPKSTVPVTPLIAEQQWQVNMQLFLVFGIPLVLLPAIIFKYMSERNRKKARHGAYVVWETCFCVKWEQVMAV